MRNKISADEYLAFLSIKYEIDPDEFLHTIASAEKNGKSACGDLLVECRGRLQEKPVLLITKGAKVVAQFPIPKEFLARNGNPIRDAEKTTMIRRHLTKKNNEPRTFNIRELRNGMKKISVKARVLEIAKPTLVFTRFGNYANVANALIADETGTIRLCLWNEQIDAISTGDTIQIENARLSMFKGEKQLRIGKKGTLSCVENVLSS